MDNNEEFDRWLRAEALDPPQAPADEWQQIAARARGDQPQAVESGSLWSFTWPSLVAAALPLLLLFGGPTLDWQVLLDSPTAQETPAEQEAISDDDQLWLTADSGGLDIVASGATDPLFLESP